MAATGAVSAAPMAGAIFTTDSTCGGTNVNVFESKADVYLDGGPKQPGAAGLPDGLYYIRVTTPDGKTELGSSDPDRYPVVSGEIVGCLRLVDILYATSDGSKGFDDTTNPDGVYKVWASQNPLFPESESKTDNFTIEAALATLNVAKFYDANANGEDDDGQYITGWKVNIGGGLDQDDFTPVTISLAPGDYDVSEYAPLESNWMATTPTSVGVTLSAGESESVGFGNLCLGEGGGKSRGFWGNKNGEALFGDDDRALMVSLSLRNADGTDFDPANYDDFETWLQGANATNMAYMLSAQLAAMELNVLNGMVDWNALVYAPGTTSANPLGFARIHDLMAEADAELAAHDLALDGSPHRSYQEALKDALDDANNNRSFVQPTPCPFSFSD